MWSPDPSIIITAEMKAAEASAAARAVQFPNLEPDRFWFAVRAAGYEAELRIWVATLNDPESSYYNPVDWAWASAKLDFGKYFERDHPLVEAARLAIGMSEVELDTLWSYASQ